MLNSIINYVTNHFDFTQTITIIILMIVLSYLSKWYSIWALRIPFFRYFNFVGIFIHEFSHYIMCKLTGARVGQFKVKLHHGYVAHGKPKIPVIGKILISLAPFFVGLVLMVTILLFMTNTSLAEFNSFTKGLSLFELLSQIFKMISRIDLSIWNLILFYLFLNLLITFVPSRQDIKNIIYALIFYFIIAGFFLTSLNQVLQASLIIALFFVIIGLLIVGFFNVIYSIILKPFR